jgi:uncharacterized membrane protein YgdD (TMEM256/DUF423 family)
MLYRIWLFLAGISGGAAVLAAAYGAHGLQNVVTVSPMIKAYDTATLYHALHSIALAVIATLLAATEGRRGLFTCVMLNIAAVAFIIGIVLFWAASIITSPAICSRSRRSCPAAGPLSWSAGPRSRSRLSDFAEAR